MEYEIRIMKPDGKIAHITSEFHLYDSVAVTSAEQRANGSAFEVWKGAECIHGASTGRHTS
jgi:hypothetical protein